MIRIPLHKPSITNKEKENVLQVLSSGNLSGNGVFTQKCHHFFTHKFDFSKVLLTSSCTDALEMCSLLLDLHPGDEIIMPSYTFVSTANAFHIFGAVPVFCDSGSNQPNLNAALIESKITSKTKAIVVMHYAGIACDMPEIRKICDRNNLFLIEDAALALGSSLNRIPLGKFGDLSTFSFHETKNITCGEGGLLVINNKKLHEKAEIIWEKGTNRAAFLRGETHKYEWVAKGSSYLASELQAAVLYAQLYQFDEILTRRMEIWKNYWNAFSDLNSIILPIINENHSLNGSLFYFLTSNNATLVKYIEEMKKNGISVSTHYRCLHKSKWAMEHFQTDKLINCEKIAETLIRLPLYMGLTNSEQNEVIERTRNFFKN